MILYKYVDAKTAELIIKNSTLKFSKAASLNDPFELTSLHYASDSEDSDQAMRFVAASMSYGILSLTRNPLNPLMWAHYGKGQKVEGGRGISLDQDNGSHAGFVFGIDTEKAGLDENYSNVIPAKYGSVIYASTKPRNPFESSDNHMFYEGLEHQFNPKILEALQRTFLYKPAYWSYEEEVRVVRNVHRRSTEIQTMDRSSFKEIYIGFRNSFNKNYLMSIQDEIDEAFPDCEIYVCGFDKKEWTFNKITIQEAIINCYY
ncbi:DUF2971 domain-containing protein [Enterobacteriaceae bacterium RIT814]|nr:DUF2971 domain-containing protein [Enterobacteriaceae bacterium RIT 814]